MTRGAAVARRRGGEKVETETCEIVEQTEREDHIEGAVQSGPQEVGLDELGLVRKPGQARARR